MREIAYSSFANSFHVVIKLRFPGQNLLCIPSTGQAMKSSSLVLVLSGIVWATLAEFSIGASQPASSASVKWHPGHYILANKIDENCILEHFRGVQKMYTWKSMEPELGKYDFSGVKKDLAFLKKHDKRLVIQIQYKAFGKGAISVPAYLKGPEYGGGIYRANSGSFDPVIWNDKVGERMDSLFKALGREFDRDPNIEAMVLPETSPSANLAKSPQEGVDAFSNEIYGKALRQHMLSLRKSFPHTAVIQYANFPQNMLEELTSYMKQIGVGLGGPDVYPRESELMNPERGVYRLYAPLSGVVPLGSAVQSPDYSVASWVRTAAFNKGQDRNSVKVDPKDEEAIPVREHLRLAQEKLHLNYMFWSQNPTHYFDNVKVLLAEPDLANDPAGGLDARCPSNAFLDEIASRPVAAEAPDNVAK